jgi:two-component sensor histidine kinase
MPKESTWGEIAKRILRISRATVDIRAAHELRELASDLEKQAKALSAKDQSAFGGPAVDAKALSGSEAPVVEEAPDGRLSTEPAQLSLRLRIRQQEILAELGVLALQGASFEQLLDQTTRLVAEGLEADFSKVLEYIPKENRLLVRAGVGWDQGVIGKATIGADLASPAGFALHTHKPVISNHLGNEERFRTPELLLEHGIRRAMNVILQGDGSPFGVLEVDSRSEGEFSEQDLSFLQGAANILGMAIERERYERHLHTALETQQILLAEINHRVKNSLQVVSSMLQLQAGGAGDTPLRAQLEEASNRVATVGRAYDRLAYDGQYKNIDLGTYLREVVNDLSASIKGAELQFDETDKISIASDHAIPVALIVNELVTNAAKYAYPKNKDGVVWIRLAKNVDDGILVSVRDEGIGLPSDFFTAKTRRLGARLVKALAAQLKAELTTNPKHKGTEFELKIPKQ